MKSAIGKAGVGLILLLALSTSPVLGGEGRIPIWQPTVIGPGQEGMYVLTRDVTANAGAPLIDVLPGTVSVDIDLNGFTLYGIDQDIIRAVGVDSLTVRNGMLMGGLGNGIYVGEGRKAVIEDVKIQFVGAHGIQLVSVANFAIRRNIIVSDAQAPNPSLGGILVDGLPAPRPLEGVIEDNQIEQTGFGIQVNVGSAVAILKNRIEEMWGGDGILVFVCDGCMIAENTVERPIGLGIVLSEVNVNKVYNNVVVAAGADGIYLKNSSDTLILENNSSLNAGDGLAIDGSRCHVDRNVLNLNNGFGLHFIQGAGAQVGDNTYGRNTARNNFGAIAPCAIVPPVEICPQPYGGGAVPPDFCNESIGPSGVGNTSFCDNLMPGPPRS